VAEVQHYRGAGKQLRGGANTAFQLVAKCGGVDTLDAYTGNTDLAEAQITGV
jgi:hypothetical protein